MPRLAKKEYTTVSARQNYMPERCEVHITRNDQQPYSKPQTFPTLGFTALKIRTEVAAILLQLAA